MAHRLAMLVNPAAGRGMAARFAAPVRDRLRSYGYQVRLFPGRTALEAAVQARAAVADGIDALIVVGGDGLVHLALQAVASSDIPLGVIPAGTGNDAARLLGLPQGRRLRDALAAADVIRRGETRRMDAGLVGTRWFLSVLSSGFDSRVTERANRLTWLPGRARYNAAIAAELRVFRPIRYELTLDGAKIETEAMLVAVCNGPSYGGGMRVCPHADVHDGLFDITVLEPLPTATFLRLFPSVYRGTHIRHPAVVTHRASKVTLAARDLIAYADGERIGPLPVTALVVPDAVTVFTPARPAASGPSAGTRP